MLENIKGVIKNGQSRETGNTGHTRRRKTQHIHLCITAIWTFNIFGVS
jgi:hypothetical protein